MEIIPDDLHRAHEDGEVVFFCGAGVSMPAGLPSFKGLVYSVLTDILPRKEMCKPGSTEALAWQAFANEKYDEALDILESPREGGFDPQDVRERVKHHLSKPRTKSLQKHLVLARLTDLDKANGRLVTTNFDHLFEKAQSKLRRTEGSGQTLAVHIAPALPPAKPEASFGLTHLHGKLGHSPGDRGLVLTMADFGAAYLLEGWARRFVIELFRHFHVIFIGYRVEDPTMRYLVSALAAARETNRHFKKAYAFAAYGEDDGLPNRKEEAEQQWRLKGLTPLTYDGSNSHSDLWRELEEWADDHRRGILGRRQMVARLGQFPPPDRNDPAIREIVWALRDKDVARYFANQTEGRADPGWIASFQDAGLLSLPNEQVGPENAISAPLVSRILPDHLLLDEVTIHLGRWISASLNSPHALDWALSSGGVLHSSFRSHVQSQLQRRNIELSSALRKIWGVLADNNYAHALSAKHTRSYPASPRLQPNDSFGIRIFLERLRPIPIFKKRYPYFHEQSDPNPESPKDWCEISIELVGIDADYEIERYRGSEEDWYGAMCVIAHDITSRLKEALDWLHVFGLASPQEDLTHIEYRSISRHSQNKHAHTWTQLIALSRDSYDALIASGDVAAAAGLARRWQSLPYPIFRRLALYAATGGENA